ncbi:UvrD-helicase domain-containing protein [Bradyrhizobium sp. CCBAU 51627]|uniref:UvrD-helicase domain-containing protein n=1 Tax=Bradyrhizobium sp. CCBAU 51627 TaxID=1325088 RepID=UPI002304E5CF|nr:UvrD-helicase domain-containing protein [Bradyrhizobium sp. CCBAU 51627]MDA9436278.1 UvrD/REP helicase [Bradyrhizobium sp. CCBAU 51627]
MDAVELGRQRAAALHREAVQAGKDPWRPYDFAVAEANRRGLDVERTAPGAAVLDGSRATLVAKDALILHENGGSLFEQAFLVVHEIAHAELGDAPEDEVPIEIDLARPAEASPMGVDRVVDYGRRQRREVQMDLFAREFLLPRPVARKLHVEDGMTASAIAEKLGAPFDVVAQQLLDALFLPSVEISPEEARPARPLNKEQADAAAHRGAAYLLEAGPGTGKTQTLTGRIELLLGDGVDPRRILVLTFSNKAAGEMASRLARKHPTEASAMWIGTFHAFGLDIIRRFHQELGLPPNPRLMDRTEAVELLENEFPKLGLRHYRDLYDPTQKIADILAAISRAKDEVVDTEEYAQFAETMKSSVPTARAEEAEKALEVAEVYRCYERLKRDAHCVDFGDLVSLPVRLLEGNAAVREHLRGTYDHVLVDEYQDVNRSSVLLLKALCGDGENLWAVGDAKQSIYRFRGASSFNMRRFGGEDFPGGIRGRLKKNYRSTPEILECCSRFAADMIAGGAGSALVSTRDSIGSGPEFRTVKTADRQPIALADAIRQMTALGYGFRDQAVLCTGNEKLSETGRELERLGIPVLFLGSLFERPEVKDLLAFLSLLTDRRAMGLLRVACWPEFGMSMADVAGLLGALREDKWEPLTWLRDPAVTTCASAPGREATSRLAAALDGFEIGSGPWEVLARLLLDRTGIGARLASSSTVSDRSAAIAIWQFMNFVRVQPAAQGLPVRRLLDRVRRLLRLGDDRDLRQLPAAAQGIDAVRLMTIHGSKGLEFPVVHLPGMNRNTLPRTPRAPTCLPPDGMIEGARGTALDHFRAGQNEEQECLFYVALSRAEERLLIYAATENAKGHRREPSEFIERIGLAPHHLGELAACPTAPEKEPIPVEIDGAVSVSGFQIGLYDSCQRRFFYTHVLNVGGRRTQTPFLQVHESVRAVLKEIVSRGALAPVQSEVEALVDQALAARGLTAHGYATGFREMALGMLDYFVSQRAGYSPEEPRLLRLAIGTGEITIAPDDVLTRKDGRRVLRRVQTGHYREDDVDEIEAGAFALAVQQHFPGAEAQVLHLSDERTSPISIKGKPLQNKRKQLEAAISGIRAGAFAPDESQYTCPNCPAFFVCGPVPPGPFRKKFG